MANFKSRNRIKTTNRADITNLLFLNIHTETLLRCLGTIASPVTLTAEAVAGTQLRTPRPSRSEEASVLTPGFSTFLSSERTTVTFAPGLRHLRLRPVPVKGRAGQGQSPCLCSQVCSVSRQRDADKGTDEI